MEILQKVRVVYVTIIIITAVQTTESQSQRTLSSGSLAYSQQPHNKKLPNLECGTQDTDQFFDVHAAAPWAAALFYVEGDFFQNQIKSKYLSTATFISKNLAITSGSPILSERQTDLLTKLQLYYGNRGSGKQTLIRIGKVEPLFPPSQPLALKVETSPAISQRVIQTQQQQTYRNSHDNTTDLFLLHLESAFDVTSFSRPLCINENAFHNKNRYIREVGNTNTIHLSGYADKNETNNPHGVSFSADRAWRVQSWDADHINVVVQGKQLTLDTLPKYFNAGSALTVKINNRFFLIGLLLRSSGSITTFRSLEKFVDVIRTKELEYSSHVVDTDAQQQPTYSAINSNNGYQNPKQDKLSFLPQQSGSNKHQDSRVSEDQRKYLEQSEFDEEIASIPSFSHDQKQIPSSSTDISKGIAGTPIWETSVTRTSTFRPGNIPNTSMKPSLFTDRPNIIYHHTQQVQHNNHHQNTGFMGTIKESSEQVHHGPTRPIIPESSTYSIHKSSTTMKSLLPSQVPPSARPGTSSFRPDHSLSNHQNRCTQITNTYLAGVDIECLSRRLSFSNDECIKSAPVNTTIRLSCKPHYEPLDGDKSIEQTCDTSGTWLPRKIFGCKLVCGTVSQSVPYIVHGSKTAPEKWPWHAALFKKVNQTTYTYICGATLIKRNILITAAHCVYNSAEGGTNKSLYKVVVGAISSDLLANRRDPQAQEFDIQTIRVNEHYNPRNYEADIALIEIKKPVRLTDYVRPVCFPFPSDENKMISSYQLSEGNSGVVVGFGITHESWSISETLRVATLPYVSVQNCTDVLKRQPSSTQYCAGYTNGTSVCEGDSGGSQIFIDQFSRRYYIQGIVSHGNRKDSTLGQSRCDHEKYTVLTKVGSFADWVDDVVNKLDIDYSRRKRK